MPGKTRGGIDWEWDGEILKDMFHPTKQYRSTGGGFSAVFGSETWSWGGPLLSLVGGDNRKAVYLEGDRIAPFNHDNDHTWVYSGGSLANHNAGRTYFIDGDIPVEVIACLVAAELNKDVDWGEGAEGEEPEPEEEGVSRLRLNNISYVRGDPNAEGIDWNKEKSGRTVALPYGCDQGCKFDCIDKCPDLHRFCDICRSELEKGEPHLHQSCEHKSDWDICNLCSGVLQKKHVIKGHAHQVVIFSEPANAKRAHLRNFCSNCNKSDFHGAWCEPCKVYLCTACANKSEDDDSCCAVM